MPAKNAEDLFLEEVREIYSAEKQLTRAIPKLSKAVRSDALRQALDRRREESARVIEALDQVFGEMQARPGRKKNAAVEGLIEDANQHVEELDDEALRDAALVGAVQKLEHYCIAAWGTAAAFAKTVGNQNAAKMLSDLVKSGNQMDEELNRLAESEINPAMMGGAGDDDAEMDDEEDDTPKRGRTKKPAARRGEANA